MPRISRNRLNSKFFHNMTQGITREYIFEEKKFKKVYINLIKKYANKFNIKLIAFTIMDNHAHLLIYTDEISNMSLFMKNINQDFAIYYNKTKNRVGFVFRNRYQCQPIYDKLHLKNCIKYIFNNPVRAKIVSNPNKYQFSNFQEFKNSKSLKDLIENYNFDFKFDISNKKDFIDTDEDKKNFIKYLVNDYAKINKIDICNNQKNMKEIIRFIKKETNATNKMIGEVLNLSTSTITNYLKNNDKNS
mgnify:CR=1 FL=1